MSSTPPFGWFQLTTHRTENSMEWAKKVMAFNPHGTLLHAENYTHVHGRQGRTWVHMPGQLLLTYLVKPEDVTLMRTADQHGVTPLVYLYYALSGAVHEAISSFVPDCHIKWPNDCMLGSKKGAGVLMEPVWSGEKLVGVAFGVGVNVNNRFERGSEMDDIAASMRTHHVRGAYDETEVLEKINQCLSHRFALWQHGSFAQIWEYWRTHHLPADTPLTVHYANGTQVSGTLVEPLITGDLVLMVDGKKVSIGISEVLSLQAD